VVRSRHTMLAYALLSGSMLAICIAVYSGFRWHHGMYFIFLLVALWLTRSEPLTGLSKHLLTFLLIVQSLICMYAIELDLRYPYSDAPLAAKYLQDHDLDKLPILGLNVTEGSGQPIYRWENDAIQPLLLELGNQHGVYDPNAGDFESFFNHYSLRDYFPVMTMEKASQRIQTIATHISKPFIVIGFRYENSNTPMTLPPILRKLTDLQRPLDFGENYSIYIYDNSIH